MQATQGSMGRVFFIRLEDGDRLPDSLERFAADNNVSRALCALVGGAAGGRLVVGPEDGDATSIEPMVMDLEGVHEAAALGTILPDESGAPKLHMHAALGRDGKTRTGCVREGVDVWRIGEVVMLEITGPGMVRRLVPEFGFSLPVPE